MRVRPIRLTVAEAKWLLERGASFLWDGAPKLRDKLLASLEDTKPGLAVGPIEDVLVTYSRGKVVRLSGGGHGRASRQATAIGVTPEQLKLVGTWLARQRWLTEPVTLITVLNKWPEWYPRALATAAPAGTQEGLGEQNVGPTPAGRGGPHPAGRPAEGLGGARPAPRPHGVRED